MLLLFDVWDGETKDSAIAVRKNKKLLILFSVQKSRMAPYSVGGVSTGTIPEPTLPQEGTPVVTASINIDPMPAKRRVIQLIHPHPQQHLLQRLAQPLCQHWNQQP